jgi:arsenate reductase (glutaredoxin)
MKDKIVVYHNSRCSKSRCALEFLQDKGLEFEVVEYLKDVPTKEDLKSVISKLGIDPEDLIRKGEEEFKTNFKDKKLTADQCIDAMVKFPKLIERPIVLKGDKGVVARPTEKIEDLL